MDDLFNKIRVKDDSYPLNEAINNVITYFTRHNATTNLSLDYNDNSQELIISCNNLQQNNFYPQIKIAELRYWIWLILKNNISINIVTPSLLYEITKQNHETTSHEENELNINLININELDKQKAKLILKPIKKGLIPLLKSNFVGLQAWKLVFKTKYGDLLINDDKNSINYIYINGIKLNSYNFIVDKIPELNFAFSYNLRSDDNNNLKQTLDSYFFIDHFFPKLIDPLLFENYIAEILENINDDNKENIYLNILNNPNSFEWIILKIKKLIVNFFTKINPDIYLISTKSKRSSIQYKLAKANGKKIIELEPNVFYELKNKKCLTLNEWAKQYYIDNFDMPISPSSLNPISFSNWQHILEFIKHFININQKLKDYLVSINCENIPIVIVSDLPIDCVWLDKIQQIWIKKSAMNDLTYLLSLLFNEIWKIVSNGINYNDFIYWWTNLIIKFANQKSFNELVSKKQDKNDSINNNQYVEEKNNPQNNEEENAKNSQSISIEHTEKCIFLNSEEATKKYPFRRPIKYSINGENYKVQKWRNIYACTCNYLYKRYHNDFINWLKNRPNYVLNEGKKYRYIKIGNTNYYVYANLTGSQIITWCQDFLKNFKVPLDKCCFVLGDKIYKN